jgi:hypothetical protein
MIPAAITTEERAGEKYADVYSRVCSRSHFSVLDFATRSS